jgi:hypothetical protein
VTKQPEPKSVNTPDRCSVPLTTTTYMFDQLIVFIMSTDKLSTTRERAHVCVCVCVSKSIQVLFDRHSQQQTPSNSVEDLFESWTELLKQHTRRQQEPVQLQGRFSIFPLFVRAIRQRSSREL